MIYDPMKRPSTPRGTSQERLIRVVIRYTSATGFTTIGDICENSGCSRSEVTEIVKKLGSGLNWGDK